MKYNTPVGCHKVVTEGKGSSIHDKLKPEVLASNVVLRLETILVTLMSVVLASLRIMTLPTYSSL